MLAVRTDAGQGRYALSAPSEWDAVFYATSIPISRRPPLLWFHGNAQSTLTDYTAHYPSLRLLAQRYTVLVADFGGSTFGNDTGIARTQDGVDYLASLGATGPVTLVGASMGNAVAMNWAVRNPEQVRAIAGVIPVVDFTAPGPGLAALNAAYPPAYDDNNTAHAAHNPIHFATDFSDGLPIRLWVSGNDPSVPNSTAEAFVAARPQTGLVDFGDYGHGGVNESMPLVIDWLRGL